MATTALHNRLPSSPPTKRKRREYETEKSFGGFLRLLHRAQVERKNPDDEVRKAFPTVRKVALNEGSGLQGGYLIPEGFSFQILEEMEHHSLFRQHATCIEMDTMEFRVPTIDRTTAQAAGTAPWMGGILFKWGAGSNLASPSNSETEPSLKQIVLTAKDLIGYAVVSNQTLYDMSPRGEAALYKIFARAAAWYEEYAFFRGTGMAQSQPLGILNASTTLNVIRNNNSGPFLINADDVDRVASKMVPVGWPNAIWACHPSCLVSLMKITGFVPNKGCHCEQTHGPGFAGSLMTRPLYVTDKLPSVGNAGDLLFFDPTAYLVGERSEVIIESSPHPLLNTNQTVVRVWLRSDGRPWPDSVTTLADGTATASDFVALQ